MYRDNYIRSLRTELLEMVSDFLTPVALRYGYSEVPLETEIKWRPQVLVLGNYSSGKSTLINEFLGSTIQGTGQAPTDDSFTIITYGEDDTEDDTVRVIEERDGKFLLSDPEYPFETLKKHGQRFASHFRLKKVNSPFLKNLALVDTPGMLDSITERDRGYNYQDVIGDFAKLADLVLVLFDPHKAGTVREAHTSLRDTLPAKTYEDRVLYVLNRIDECVTMTDLLRVYGTLCWNLSQITGRKDIPMIHLTYSPHAVEQSSTKLSGDTAYIKYLENQREELKKAVQRAPFHRLDNLATFVETHGERLSHLLEALISFRKKVRISRVKSFFSGLGLSLVAGGAAWVGAMFLPPLSGLDPSILLGGTGAIAVLFFFFWQIVVRSYLYKRFRKKWLRNLDGLTSLSNQTRRDSWASVRDLVYRNLKDNPGRYSLREISHEYATVWDVYDKGSVDIREALRELSALSSDDEELLDFDGGEAMDENQTHETIRNNGGNHE